MIAELLKIQIIAPNEVIPFAEEACRQSIPGGSILKELLAGKISKDDAIKRLTAMPAETEEESELRGIKFGEALAGMTTALRNDLQNSPQVLCTKK